MHLLAFLTVLLCALQCRSQCNVLDSGVDSTQQGIILDQHNTLRSNVANDFESGLPPAANMLEMAWNSELAEKAQNWANQCIISHDTQEDRDTGHGYTGQNIALTKTLNQFLDWRITIQEWFDEVDNFNATTIDSYVFDSATANFTQYIWAKTYQIGCGYVKYQEAQDYFHFYVCDYLPGGNVVGESIYEEGAACSECGGCGNITGLCAPPVTT